jgi:hypothetical protein
VRLAMFVFGVSRFLILLMLVHLSLAFLVLAELKLLA